MIKITGLNKSFGKNHVLQNIDLEFRNSGIVAILGPNGSGKTTLLKCLLGLTIYDNGEITFNNKSVKGEHLYRTHISHLPQIANFPDNLSPRELIHMLKDLRDCETREDYFIEMFDLEKELDKRMANLSGGNKQKVNLTLSLMFDSPVLILDEPTSGLDPLAIINLKTFLEAEKARGKLILITTHIMSFADDLADRVVFLMDRKIYFNDEMALLKKLHKASSLELAIAKIQSAHDAKILEVQSLIHDQSI